MHSNAFHVAWVQRLVAIFSCTSIVVTFQVSATGACLDRIDARLDTRVEYNVWRVLLPRLLTCCVGELRAHLVLAFTGFHVELV